MTAFPAILSLLLILNLAPSYAQAGINIWDCVNSVRTTATKYDSASTDGSVFAPSFTYDKTACLGINYLYTDLVKDDGSITINCKSGYPFSSGLGRGTFTVNCNQAKGSIPSGNYAFQLKVTGTLLVSLPYATNTIGPYPFTHSDKPNINQVACAASFDIPDFATSLSTNPGSILSLTAKWSPQYCDAGWTFTPKLADCWWWSYYSCTSLTLGTAGSGVFQCSGLKSTGAVPRRAYEVSVVLTDRYSKQYAGPLIDAVAGLLTALIPSVSASVSNTGSGASDCADSLQWTDLVSTPGKSAGYTFNFYNFGQATQATTATLSTHIAFSEACMGYSIATNVVSPSGGWVGCDPIQTIQNVKSSTINCGEASKFASGKGYYFSSTINWEEMSRKRQYRRITKRDSATADSPTFNIAMNSTASQAARKRKRAEVEGRFKPVCARGSVACPVGKSISRFECIDTNSNLDSCGGCPDTPGSQDCGSIRGVRNVECRSGRCKVLQCNRGYTIASNGTTCLDATSSEKSYWRRMIGEGSQ